MKILHVIPSFLPAARYGGPIQTAAEIGALQAARGHHVIVATTNIDGVGVLDVPTEEPVIVAGMEVRYFPVTRVARSYCYSPKLRRFLATEGRLADVVHVHSLFLWPTTAAALASRSVGVPYIIRPAGMLDRVCIEKPYAPSAGRFLSRAKKEIYLRTLGRVDLSGAAALHFTSQAEAKSAEWARLDLPAFVIPLGVPARILDREADVSFIGNVKRPTVIAYLARLDRKKGLELLLESVAILGRKRSDFELVIAGSGEAPYSDSLLRLVEDKGLGHLVKFVGFLENDAKWKFLRDADIFVLPSFSENFGIAVIEAMAAGTPVVVSDQVQIHEEISKAGAGLVVDRSAEAVRIALERLLDSPAWRQSAGQNGRTFVKQTLTWERIAPRIEAMYARVVKSGSRS